MRVLILGSGGREHALCWKIAQSPLLTQLYVAPGNAGMESSAKRVPLAADDVINIGAFALDQKIDLVVVGPEAPLAVGIIDHLTALGVLAFGPTRAAALVESSKAFTKELCDACGAPTAAYARFTNAAKASDYVRNNGAPIVVKWDGLAAGKGVVVAETVAQAIDAIEEMFKAGSGEIVIEEFMPGEEASLFVLTDGKTALPFGGAQDHKRAFDGDLGPNTGGMGAYSPAPILDDAMTKKAMETIVQPCLDELARRGTPYSGILYAGLMIDQGKPRLVEYNARFGDPECQVLMLRLDEDLLPLLLSTARGELGVRSIAWRPEIALSVVMASKGYPGNYKKGSKIQGLGQEREGVVVFHAATTTNAQGQILADGGRVLTITAKGKTVEQARERAYDMCRAIDWPEGFYRTDIGWRAMGR